MVQRDPDIPWQVQHDNDLWEVFRKLGDGFKAVLKQASDGKHIWVTGKGETGNAEFYVKPEIVKELQSCGFVRESYELSKEGARIHGTLKSMSLENGKDEFLAQFRKYRREASCETTQK